MGKAPENTLTLKWAHGFRSFDTRGNLRYNADGQVVFTTAGVGVVYDKNAHTQEFSNIHHEDIVAMAMHPDGDLVATGQMAGKGLTDKTVKGKGRQALKQGKLVDVFVWKSSTREVVAKISGFQRRAISQLAFSPNGQRLLTIGKDDHNSVAVYDWANQAIIGSSKVDPAQVFAAAWKDENTFSTCGMKHCKTFTLSGANLNGKKNSYSGSTGMIAMTALNYVLNGILVTGAQDGSLIKWNGSSAGKPIK
jgi:microtubule-associated protein-like 6